MGAAEGNAVGDELGDAVGNTVGAAVGDALGEGGCRYSQQLSSHTELAIVSVSAKNRV